MGVDQVGLYLLEQRSQSFHVRPAPGAVGDAVYLIDPGPGLLQRPLQGAAPGQRGQRLKLLPVSVTQIVQNHPARAAEIGVADDVHHTGHIASSLPSGSLLRLAHSAPMAK